MGGKRSLLWVLVCFLASQVYGIEWASFFMPVGAARPSLRYQGTLYAKVPMHGEDLSFSVPVVQDERDLWQVSGKARLLAVDTSAVLPGTGVAVPKHLWDVGTGVSYRHRYENESSLGFTVNVGSASDRPFASYDVSTLDATVFYGFRSSEKSRWLLLLNYSNNRPILNNVPFPGVAYFYMPAKTFRAVFGVPFASVHWEPFNRATLSFFILAPWFIRSEISYGVTESLQLFTGFEYYQALFIRKDRAVKSERFYYNDKRLMVGLKYALTPDTRLTFTAGQAFGREFFEGQRFNKPTSGVLKPASAPFVQWTLTTTL